MKKEVWLPCDGRPVSKTQYPKLYQMLGVNYGATKDTFKLPDTRVNNYKDPDMNVVQHYILADGDPIHSDPIGTVLLKADTVTFGGDWK